MRQQQSIAPKVEDFQFSLRSPSNTTTSQVARHSTAQQNAFLTQVQQQPVSSSTKTKKRAKKGSRPSQEGKF